MYVLLFLLLLIVLILVLTAFYPLKVSFTLNSEQQPDIDIRGKWLSPLLAGRVDRHGGQLFLAIYLFNKRIYERPLMAEKKKRAEKRPTNKLDLIRAIKPYEVKLHAYYGFEDPAVTGMICGAVDMVSEFVIFDTLDNNPDFFTIESYYKVNGSAEINVFNTIARLIRLRKPNLAVPILHGNK